MKIDQRIYQMSFKHLNMRDVTSLKAGSCHEVNFVVIGGKRDYHENDDKDDNDDKEGIITVLGFQW